MYGIYFKLKRRIYLRKKWHLFVHLLASNLGDMARNARTGKNIASNHHDFEAAVALAINRVTLCKVFGISDGLTGLQVCATRQALLLGLIRIQKSINFSRPSRIQC